MLTALSAEKLVPAQCPKGPTSLCSNAFCISIVLQLALLYACIDWECKTCILEIIVDYK